MRSTAGAVLAALLLLTGCGSEDDSLSSAAKAEAASVEAAKAEAEKAKAEAEQAKAEAEKAKAEAEKVAAEAAVAPPDVPAAAPAPVSGQIAVPSVVGIDHQLAQDTMQAAGLYNLSEEDATGAGRMLVLDRNWVVVEQVPAAGTLVATDATITLRSKKKGE